MEMPEEKEETIDQKQFVITTKVAIAFLFFWTTTIASVLGTYFALKDQFKDNDYINRIQDLRMDGLNNDIQTLRKSDDINKSRIDAHDKAMGDADGRITILELKQDK